MCTRLKRQLPTTKPIAISSRKTTNSFGIRRSSHRAFLTGVNPSFRECFHTIHPIGLPSLKFHRMTGSMRCVNSTLLKKSSSISKRPGAREPPKEGKKNLKQEIEAALLLTRPMASRMMFSLKIAFRGLLCWMEEKRPSWRRPL